MSDNWTSEQNRRPPAASESPTASDESTILAAWQQGRGAWPQLTVPLGAFREQAGLPRMRPRAELHAADLYLACGCAHGDRLALQIIDEVIFRRIPTLISRLRPTETFAEEVAQQVRLRLLVADGEGRPRIGLYSGSGPLLAFVRITAVRTAINLRSARGEAAGVQLPDEDHGRQQLAGGELDPELRYLKERYRSDFEAALAGVFAALPSKQRNLLRLRFIGGLTDQQIGAALGVHQTTATRWMAAARAAVLDGVREHLKERLHITSSEFESLLTLVHSQLEVDLPAVLHAAADSRERNSGGGL